ncbi:GNAT family N-acetyltransferase [Agromyces atrinae]|uniref:N-acetyltransferase n=1 Tax=Agromyces atrinae TaxID=592376 RepID=A0A4Q2M8J6_9MICO|nr:GNAT family protein [Agromyces atrinae]NYD68171.1 RimJ/RimL family protein N-acetyltransferase [Agromyces atrinae]RXZ87687.1 N-acetyltransferase [Agromyces atrinae]
MTATPLPTEPLIGRFVRVDPLVEADLPELSRALRHPEVFAVGYGGGPAALPADDEAFADFARAYYPWRDRGVTWAIRRIDDGRLVGTSTLGDVELENEAVHLGWTAYDPIVWGTAVNPETKLLLLGRAFDSGFGRVKLQADAINDRSRAAILKLGAMFEGVLRRDRPRADGTWRDTAVYSVLVDEWPRVRAGLEERVAAF